MLPEASCISKALFLCAKSQTVDSIRDEIYRKTMAWHARLQTVEPRATAFAYTAEVEKEMHEAALTKRSVRRAVLKNEPVELCGIKFYALTMNDYEKWQEVKGVLLARQSTFPVAFLSMPFLDALFQMDLDALRENGKALGYTHAVLTAMAMAMQFPEGSVESQRIRIVTHQGELKGFLVEQPEDAQPAFIPKEMFPQVRELLAWQQGEDVPDESMNDELLEDEKWLAQKSASELLITLDSVIASVALNSRMRYAEVCELSILEFDLLRRAIDRDKKYMICGIAENSGTKWKGGNPYPSWCYDKKPPESATLTHISRFDGIAQH